MRYVKPMIVSFLLNNEWFEGDIIIIYDNELLCLTEEHKKELKFIYQNIIFRHVDKCEYDKLINKYKHKMASSRWQCVFYKYEIFKMTDYDKVLLLDSDMIINNSLLYLFKEDISLGVVCETKKNYFNAGTIYLGNKTYINNHSFKRVYEFTLDNGPYLYPEQDALNYCFKGDEKTFIPLKYNTCNVFSSHRNHIEDAIIIHYLDKPKSNNKYENRLFLLYQKLSSSVKLFRTPIDILIPYVDPSDENWLTQYLSIFPNEHLDSQRYGYNPVFKYVFRGIEKHLPWVRDVYLLVESESQIPQWLDKTKIKIVYHKDIIPKEYLPTYNSNCFECFLHNIEGLSEYFLYFNDDFFVLKNLYPTYFFDETNSQLRCKINLYLRSIDKTLNPSSRFFLEEIKNSWVIIGDKLNKPFRGVYTFTHHAHGLIKSSCDEVYNLLENEIIQYNTSKKRTKQNMVQIWNIYNYFTNKYFITHMEDNYIEVSKEQLNTVEKIMKDKKTMCLNAINADCYEKLINLFDDKFPDKSKYEK